MGADLAGAKLMERAILNEFSTMQIVVLSVGGMVLLALAGVLIARRAFPDLAQSRFAEVADGLRVVYELIFALILAFVIAAVLDTMSDAEGTVADEATQIAQLERVNDAFDDDDKLHLNDALHAYVHALVDHEWKAMKDGKESPAATAALEAVYVEYRDLDPKGAVQEESFSLALSKLDDVASERRARLNIAAADLPTMLRVLVGIGIVLLLILEYRPELSSGASLAFMGVLAAIVTSAYLLTLVLNYPFAGEISVSNDPLKRDRLASFWDRELRYQPADGDQRVALKPSDLQGSWNSSAFGTLVMRCYERGDTPMQDAPKGRGRCADDDDWYGVYRYHDGVVTGRLAGGMFRGLWREQPATIDDGKSALDGAAREARPQVANRGAFAWRAVRRQGETLIVGCWIYGNDASSDPEMRHQVHPGWDLEPLGTRERPVPEPRDLADRFRFLRFRSAPRVPRTPQPVYDCAHRAS